METSLSPGTPANFSGLMPTSHRQALAQPSEGSLQRQAYMRMKRLWEGGLLASLAVLVYLFLLLKILLYEAVIKTLIRQC